MSVKIGKNSRTADQSAQKEVIRTNGSIKVNDLEDGEVRDLRGTGVSGVGMHNSSNPSTRALNGIRTASEKRRQEAEENDS